LADAESDFNAMLDLARAIEDSAYECAALNALANPFFTMNAPQRGDELSRTEKALQIAEQTGDQALRAEAIVNLALRHSVVGEPGIAKSMFEAAIPLARSAGHHRALLSTLTYRGVGHFFQTEFREAEGMLREASELASRLRDGVLLRTALFFLGWTQASLGRMSEALATLDEVFEMAQRNGDRHFLSRVPKRTRWIHWELQGFPYTIQHSQAGAEITVRNRSEEVTDSPINLIHLMYETGPSGNQEKASTEMEEWHFSGVRFQAGAAESALSQGDLKRAEEQAHALLDNCLRHGPPKYLAVAHKILAEIAMGHGDLANAEQELTAALEPLRTNPAPLIAWKTYATLGRLQQLKNDPQSARDAYGCAAEIVQKIASSVDDEQLRSTFLNAPAVQEVLRGRLCATTE